MSQGAGARVLASQPMRARLFSFAAVAVLAAACGGASAPPSVTPRVAPPPILPAPPWESRSSVADGYEPVRAAPPSVFIRGATLMLATGKTIARGSILLANGKIAAITEGDATPPAGAVVSTARASSSPLGSSTRTRTSAFTR